MAPLSTSTLTVGSTSLANVSSARHRPPSLAVQRKEGWTEVWGVKDKCINHDGKSNDDGDGAVPTTTGNLPYLPPRYITVLKDGCDYVGEENNVDGSSKARGTSQVVSGQQHPSIKLKLSQYRVAWFEQIVLRMNRIPHMVENSGYAATESTGALPCLLDSSNDGGGANNNTEKQHTKSWENSGKSVLIGRNQPGGMGSSFSQQCYEDRKSQFIHSGSHIIDYLRLTHPMKVKDNILFPEHMQETGQSSGDAMAYESLIQEKLNYILLALRYGNDPSWEGVYRPQCIHATLDPNSEYHAGTKERKPFFSVWAWYQSYSERSLALYNLLPSTHAMSPSIHGGLSFELFRYNDYRNCSTSIKSSNANNNDEDDDGQNSDEKTTHQHHPFSSFFSSYGGSGGGSTGRVNVYRAMEFGDLYYSSLENKLAAASCVGTDGQTTYFLGTEKPTYIDALLFAHLAEALCDVHLVLVLAKYSRLTKYFQWMYDQFFGEAYTQTFASESTSWVEKNNIVNALNAFNQIPEATSTKQSSSTVSSNGEGLSDMVHAIQLMQKLAVHCKELDEALQDAAALRALDGEEKAVLDSYHRPMGSRLYGWIMGREVKFWGSGNTAKLSNDGEVLSDKDTGNDEGSYSSGDEHQKGKYSEDDKKQKDIVKRMKRDRRTNDELWLSGVAAVFVVTLVISASSKSKQ